LTDATEAGAPPAARGSALEVLITSLGLGLTSFGGPIAHIGYFERTYVTKRHWLSMDEFAGLVALCQLTPGPASSKVGFLIGLRRAGWVGALAAWIGFTLPSAIVMTAFALLAPRLAGPLMDAVLHGLKLVAVVVVSQAVWNMAQRLTPDLKRKALAVIAASLLLLLQGPWIQILALGTGAVGGALVCRDVAANTQPLSAPIGARTAIAALILFLVLLLLCPFVIRAMPHSLSALCAIFYQAGALVFGGGHVVLPLLRNALVPGGWLTDDNFLAGYGMAQAVPGPLFTFSAYLAAAIAPKGSVLIWSAAGLVAMFSSGLLIALASFPLWNWVGHHATARGALAGINAAVVGILGAALYNPICTNAIRSTADVAIATIGLALLMRSHVPPIVIVGFCVGASLIVSAVT
jgi:chromate transporter